MCAAVAAAANSYARGALDRVLHIQAGRKELLTANL